MNTIPNRRAICETLMEKAGQDKTIVVLCSDSRGSASLEPFAQAYPQQFVEVGIAEQDLVSIAAGMASCGLKPFAASPACFLSTRSLEQIKVDVAYSQNNVKLIGISGGISYGPLGMTHHSTQDIACIASIPGMRVYLPSDRHQTKCLMEALVADDSPAYLRVGRNPVEDVYTSGQCNFVMDKATVLQQGKDITIIACGEMVREAQKAGEILKQKGISARVLDMYCVKPIDRQAVLDAARETGSILTVEEHSAFGGMGSIVSQIVSTCCPVPVVNMALPDQPAIAGTSRQVFDYYGLNASGIAENAERMIKSSGKIYPEH